MIKSTVVNIKLLTLLFYFAACWACYSKVQSMSNQQPDSTPGPGQNNGADGKEYDEGESTAIVTESVILESKMADAFPEVSSYHLPADLLTNSGGANPGAPSPTDTRDVPLEETEKHPTFLILIREGQFFIKFDPLVYAKGLQTYRLVSDVASPAGERSVDNLDPPPGFRQKDLSDFMKWVRATDCWFEHHLIGLFLRSLGSQKRYFVTLDDLFPQGWKEWWVERSRIHYRTEDPFDGRPPKLRRCDATLSSASIEEILGEDFVERVGQDMRC